MSHTPGPWAISWGRWDRAAPIFGFAVRAAGKDPSICGAGVSEPHPLIFSWPEGAPPHPSVDRYFSEIEIKANAHLIAAAPDLLEALKNIVARTTPAHRAERIAVPPTFAQLKTAEAAIAKAEGRDA